MGVATVRGQLTGIEGVIDLDEAAPEHSSVEVRIPIATINTGQQARDNHLLSDDFFAAESFPFMVSRSTGIEPDGEAFNLHGDLTIRDVTRPVVLETNRDGSCPARRAAASLGSRRTPASSAPTGA
jgi:polyisoprenoid-binding protein YceI